MTLLAAVAVAPSRACHEPATLFARRAWLYHIGLGLARGIGIGIVARGFMRLLSGDPGFSLSGTLFIIGLFTFFGTVQGVVAGTRARTDRRRFTAPIRFLGAFSYLILGLGAGIVMAPFLWTMGPALARRDWHRRVRFGLAGVAALNFAAVIAMHMNEEDFELVHVGGFVVLLVTYLAIAWTAGPTFDPGNSGSADHSA